jgi:hypothetical protein
MMLGVLHVVFNEYRYTVYEWGKGPRSGEVWVDGEEMPGMTVVSLGVVRGSLGWG